jgi:hypothetical protein
LFFATESYAVYSPQETPNNIFGIHILFPTELGKAATLVNSSGGDWGYVTIPIQYNDRDVEKWQDFMNNAQKHHLIPIIRIATSPHYSDTSVWRKPDDFDVVDFANFLNSLEWPTKNRYVLLFNEVNRFDEWGGGLPNPEEYADAVVYATDVFKERNPDFFIIAGGLDNAAPSDGIKFIDNLVYLRRMGMHNAQVFEKIDGFASHSYPNPNFAEAPSLSKIESTATYKHELAVIDRYTDKELPVFISETGWNAEALPQSVIASYFKISMNEIWGKDTRVVAVTPFILESGGGPFDKFTFFKGEKLTSYGQVYRDIPKKKGEPELNTIRIAEKPRAKSLRKSLFVDLVMYENVSFSSPLLKTYFKSLLAI